MHPYLTEEDVRTRVFIMCAILAVGSGWELSQFLIGLPFSVPWWIETPSVLGFFGFYMWLYNNFLWKIWPFSNLEWFCIPNLNGKWKVKITSSYKGFEEVIPASATIRQTATKISIALRTDNSSSYSTSAALLKTEHLSTYELKYHYTNYPNPEAVNTMEIHHGSAWLGIEKNNDHMNGDYFTGRGRQQYGKLCFLKKK